MLHSRVAVCCGVINLLITIMQCYAHLSDVFTMLLMCTLHARVCACNQCFRCS